MKKTVELISTGNELLSGRTLNRHAQTLAQQIAPLGYRLVRDTTVGDDPTAMTEVLKGALERVDIVVLSGGLGPTVDDVTRDVVAAHLGRSVVMDEHTREILRQYSEDRGLEFSENRQRQALIVEGARVLDNAVGAAPGELIEDNGKALILLPGPPNEFMSVLTDHVLPWLREQLGEDALPLEKIFLVVRMAEADIATRFEESEFSPENVEVAYCAAAGRVEVRLNAMKGHEEELEEAADRVREMLGDRIYSEERMEVDEAVGRLLIEKGVTVATAESCTGGLLGDRLTDVSGSSKYYLGGIVAYANEVKVRELDVDQAVLDEKGAVSPEIAERMAVGVRERFGSDYGVGITGIAGPTGGTPEKPVGLVYIAISDSGRTTVERFEFGRRRRFVKQMSSQTALDLLRGRVLGFG